MAEHEFFQRWQTCLKIYGCPRIPVIQIYQHTSSLQHFLFREFFVTFEIYNVSLRLMVKFSVFEDFLIFQISFC